MTETKQSETHDRPGARPAGPEEFEEVVPALRVPAGTMARVRELAEALATSDIHELAQAVYEEVLPLVQLADEAGDQSWDLLTDRIGWDDLWSPLASSAAEPTPPIISPTVPRPPPLAGRRVPGPVSRLLPTVCGGGRASATS